MKLDILPVKAERSKNVSEWTHHHLHLGEVTSFMVIKM